ncbi:alpha/beta fold hydrolase [Paraburkholderia youngii]|uniref:alpha/beta fold hydrolase n=1 Tax=Paraburkholderia youngii TaxID=2782701 RepID=UPI003D1F1865
MTKVLEELSAAIIDIDRDDSETNKVDFKMHPVYFGGHFGWLHEPRPQSNENGKAGIVLCGPLGHEALWLHQTMRSLTDRLAGRGFAALRFDYAGTGDSIDLGELVEPGRWVDEAAEAVDFMRRTTGVERVALIGFRFGAMVAAQAARAARVDTVALVAPVVAGRQFVREMNALQRTWLDQASHHIRNDAAPTGAFDVLGHRFSRAAIDAITQCDLRRMTSPPASKMLIVHPSNQGPSHELADSYSALGAQVDSLPFPEYPEAMQPSWVATLPQATLGSVEGWFAREFAPSSAPLRSAVFDAAAAPVAPRRSGGWSGAVETPVDLANGRLFGILCEPEGCPERAPLVVIANTAATHHVGDGRFNVELARSLARAGIASLRVDAHGIGDSRGAWMVEDPSLLSYEQLAADTSLAVDWALARGHPRVAVFGICSGAYLALHAATKNPSVTALLLVNLQKFDFPADFRMCDAIKVDARSTRAIFRAMFRTGKWSQVLRGEVGLRPVWRTLSRYAVDAVVSNAAAWAGDSNRSAMNKGTRARQRMKDLDARGVHVRLLFSPLDRGLDELRMHFGRGGRRLNKLLHASAMVIPNMDHEVLNPAARQRIAALCETFFNQAFARE